jgi:hypothetical protein
VSGIRLADRNACAALNGENSRTNHHNVSEDSWARRLTIFSPDASRSRRRTLRSSPTTTGTRAPSRPPVASRRGSARSSASMPTSLTTRVRTWGSTGTSICSTIR